MKPTFSVQKLDNSQKLAASLAALRKKDVLVGIPAEKSSRKGEGPNNAELLYIHTHGSELKHIPARPVIEPAIEDAKQPIADLLGHAAAAVIEEKPAEATTYLRGAGMRGMAASKSWFTNPLNGWAPNAPSTIKRKGSDTPLIDTGELRKSITYVLRDNK